MTIAVVVPTHNRALYLRRTLESVLAQTRPADEIVVVDDGSTDDTRGVVAAFDAAAYLYQENAFVGAARNRGLGACRAEAVLFLDSDDLLLPGALGYLEAALAANPDTPLSFGGWQEIDGEDRPLGGPQAPPDAVGYAALTERNVIRAPGCALVRRAALERAGGWATERRFRGNEDWRLWFRLADLGPFATVREPVLAYRVHGAGMSADAAAMYATALAVLGDEVRRQRGRPARLARLAVRYADYAARWRCRQAGDAYRAGDRRRTAHLVLRAALWRPSSLRYVALLSGVPIRLRDVLGWCLRP